LRGYLIDTQIISFWFNRNLPEHGNVCDHINALPDSAPLLASVISLGEIAFGHAITAAPDPAQQAAFSKFLQENFPFPLAVTRFTVEYYSRLRAALFRKYPPRGKKQRRPEQYFDPITSEELGIDENDLWIASQACERTLVLVTHDKMCRIRDVAAQLLTVENWTDPI